MASDPEILDLFPAGTQVVDGEIRIGGMRARDLAEQFGTPAMLVDEVALRARAREYVAGLSARWPNSLVYFASKAFPCTAIYRVMVEEGLGIDVAGGGELVMALKAGADPDRILLHGNAKSDEEIRMAVDAGVGIVVVDNHDDITRLEAVLDRPQDVLVRVRPGVVGHTHAAMETASETSKFGMSLAQAERAIARIRTSRFLRLRGLHVHVGSQILRTEPFAEAVGALASLGEFEVYDLGGGLGERYTYADTRVPVDTYLDVLTAAAREHLPAGARILLEPGRSLTARSTVTMYRAVTVKDDGKTFVAVDGGMGDNLEVSLYGQRFEAVLPERPFGSREVAVVGRHCESGDFLSDPATLADPVVGDLVVVPVTGAYCFTMSNNYNGALRPPVVFVKHGSPTLLLRRETYDDLTRRDCSPH